ncbi:hypothetical protein BYT27DRAFT_7070339, partial [Phlegmacium glaucopus]
MIEHLAVLIHMFPGAANHTQCFAHILNLVAKSVPRQFEAPKAKGEKAMDDAARELAAVLDELDDNQTEGLESGGNKGGDLEGNSDEDDDVVDDDEDGLPDERDEMEEDKVANLEASIKPIQAVLTKVSVSLAIKNSSTIILPRWYVVLKSLAL